MYIRILLLFAISCLPLVPATGAQKDSAETAAALHTVAQRVLRQATFDFEDPATGRRFSSPGSAPRGSMLRPSCPYNDWRYWNGVLAIAMDAAGTALRESSFCAFPARDIAFMFTHAPFFRDRYAGEDKWGYPFAQLFLLEELDDCGAMGAAVIDVSRWNPDTAYASYIDRATAHLMLRQTRLPDRTFSRSFPRPGTVWADDLYMSVPFLARLGSLKNDGRYFDEAMVQVRGFYAHLFDKTKGIMSHCWYADQQLRGGAFWGRANGWAVMAQVELLDRLPANDPRRHELLALLTRHLRGIAQHQSRSGLWHQVLDRADSYLETSCSAMFTFAIARAVRRGYLGPEFAAVARTGWAGIRTRIRADGQIEGVCTGTVVSEDPEYYLTRPAPLNDVHGIGAVLLAGAEVLSLPF